MKTGVNDILFEMRRVSGEQFESILPYFKAAAKIALRSNCHKGSCGAVIVKDGEIIGKGYVGPPKGLEQNRTCDCDDDYDYSLKIRYDKTCCVHAEWRAILDATKHHGSKINGASLYFVRVDENGGFKDSSKPLCTVCSRLSLEAGLKDFALYNNNGADVYNTDEYDRASYAYYKNNRLA